MAQIDSTFLNKEKLNRLTNQELVELLKDSFGGGTTLPSGTNGDTLTLVAGSPAWFTVTHSEPANSLGTVYQNANTRPIYLQVTVRCRVDYAVSLITGASYVQLKTDANNPPTSVTMDSGFTAMNIHTATGTDYITGDFAITGIILPSNYYKLVIVKAFGGQDPSIVKWHEYVL
jgi:hypothetical protein